MVLTRIAFLMEGNEMKKRMVFGVVGGDMRQGKLAELLAGDGHKVHMFGLEKLQDLPNLPQAENLKEALKADCVILPLPVREDNGLNMPFSTQQCSLDELVKTLQPGQIVCAGMVPPYLALAAGEKGVKLYDYFAREELAVATAVPTAEGAIQLAMEELPVTISGARVLIIGYGRLGRTLAPRLAALGADLSVAARKYSDLAWIEASGWKPEHTEKLDEKLGRFDLIINTAPARVLNEKQLLELNKDCLCIDLASRPGGVDFETAAQLGVKVIWALSLPGKVAPVTAGKAIRDTIYNILQELGV